MTRSPLPALLLLSACVLLMPPAPAHAQLKNLPQLGSPLPSDLATADKPKFCRTGGDHLDPCSEVEIGGVRYTIAWDEQSKAVTYLYTDDHHIVTDNGLAVGNDLRVGDGRQYDPTLPYLKNFIDPKWKDTDTRIGSAAWYAVLHKDDYDRHFGQIIGFVQSSYIPAKQ